jgi:hypothetical protein
MADSSFFLYLLDFFQNLIFNTIRAFLHNILCEGFVQVRLGRLAGSD